MDRNVKTAIAIDEWTPGAPITSMVDDVFFIVQKCGRRAISTGNVQSGCAVLGQVNSLLTGELRSSLDAKWKVRLYIAMRRSRPRSTGGLAQKAPRSLSAIRVVLLDF